MQGSLYIEHSGLSGFRLCPPLESWRQAEGVRQIIIPVDLTNDCARSIDYAICFAKVFGSTSEFTPPLSGTVHSEPDVSKPRLRSVQRVPPESL
jgi:hypothetical protein